MFYCNFNIENIKSNVTVVKCFLLVVVCGYLTKWLISCVYRNSADSAQGWVGRSHLTSISGGHNTTIYLLLHRSYDATGTNSNVHQVSQETYITVLDGSSHLYNLFRHLYEINYSVIKMKDRLPFEVIIIYLLVLVLAVS